MYRYMHTVRLYNSSDDADVRPSSDPGPLARLRVHLDYAAWHSRLRAANAVPAASRPVIALSQPEQREETDRRAA